MNRLSIIVPLTDDRPSWEATLASVLQNRPAGCEILVPHRGVYDDPYELSNEVFFLEASASVSLAEMLNMALRVCRHEVFHILLPGAEVEEGWAAPALAHFATAEVASVSPLLVQAQAPPPARGRRAAAAGVVYGAGGRRRLRGVGKRTARLSSKMRITGPTLQSAFYRRGDLLEAGGFEPAVGEALLDVDAAMSLAALGKRCVFEPQCVVHIQEIWGPADTPFARFRDAERLFWRHAQTAGWTKSLAFHAAGLLGECATASLRLQWFSWLAGRCWGLVTARGHGRRRQDSLNSPRSTVARAGSLSVPHAGALHVQSPGS